MASGINIGIDNIRAIRPIYLLMQCQC